VTRRRALKVAEQIRDELSDILRYEVRDPRVGFVSIVDVELSTDLRHAKVYVSVFGSDTEQHLTLTALRSATGFIRTELGKRIRLRHVPELVFVLDQSIAHGQRIETLLRQLHRDEEAAPSGGDQQPPEPRD